MSGTKILTGLDYSFPIFKIPSWLKMAISGLFLAAFCVQNAYAYPAQIIIIRHAEKPPTGNHLSVIGQKRAYALVSYFLKNQAFLQYGKPVAVYAQAPNSEDASLRPIETCQPTATALGVTIQKQFTRQEYKKMAAFILTNSAYDGKTLLICWEHKVIPQLAAALGVNPKPPKWPGDIFDRTWVITYNKEGQVIRFQNLPQRLLVGDSF